MELAIFANEPEASGSGTGSLQGKGRAPHFRVPYFGEGKELPIIINMNGIKNIGASCRCP